MPPRKIELSAADDRARARVQSFRRMRGMTLADVSRALGDRGHPMSVSSLSQVENGGRRMDVGDVVALAEVFGVRARFFVEEGSRPGDSMIPEDMDTREVNLFLLQRQAEMEDRIRRLESGQPEPTHRPEGPGMNEVTLSDLGIGAEGGNDGDS